MLRVELVIVRIFTLEKKFRIGILPQVRDPWVEKTGQFWKGEWQDE